MKCIPQKLFVLFLLVLSSRAVALTPSGVDITDRLRIAAVIHTVERGEVEARWHPGKISTTARGDTVLSGWLYASLGDVTWGNDGNPDIYVKIWLDVSGRIDVNFFHVSVPDISVYSAFETSDWSQENRTTMYARYVRHEYFDFDGGSVPEDPGYTLERARWQVYTVLNSPLTSNSIRHVESDGNGGVYIATDEDFFYFDGGATWRTLEMDAGDTSPRVRALQKDTGTGIWVGTSIGLLHLDQAGNQRVFSSANAPLTDNPFSPWSFAPDTGAGIWFGSAGGILGHFDGVAVWEMSDITDVFYPSRYIRDLDRDENDGLWIAFQSLYDTPGTLGHRDSTGYFTNVGRFPSAVENAGLNCIAADGVGGAWAGASAYQWRASPKGMGLAHYLGDGTWERFTTDNSGLPGNRVVALERDAMLGVWIGIFPTSDNLGEPLPATGGLVYYNGNGGWVAFNTTNSDIPGDEVVDISADGAGGLWIATYQGLAHLSFNASGS